MRKLLLLSNSIVHGYDFLGWAKESVVDFFEKSKVKEILFVPYANVKSQEEYTEKVRTELAKFGLNVKGLNEVVDPVLAVESAEAIFIGGGNTFLLLKLLQEKKLIEPIRRRVFEDSVPYMGSSAGTNVATISINTTNDMPIVFPSTLSALALVPFNINPHFIDVPDKDNHKGETREDRINEYHSLLGKIPPVLGLREGTFLRVEGDTATLGGICDAKLFIQGQDAKEYKTGADLSFLLNCS